MNGMFVGAFCYADDVTLLAPTGMALNAMLDTCTRFADNNNSNNIYLKSSIQTSSIDSYDAHNSYLIRPRQNVCLLIGVARNCIDVQFIGRSVEFVNSVDLLGVPLYADLKVNHIHRKVQKFYLR